LALNCLITGEPPTVAVAAGETKTVTVPVSCSALPGDLNVSVSSTGEDFDLSGYLISIDGQVVGRVPATGSLRLEGLDPGTRAVSIGEISSNCGLVAPQTVNIEVRHSTPATVAFPIACHHTPRIAYNDGVGISIVSADGSDNFRLPLQFSATLPTWSPDGSRFAFVSSANVIYVADGSGGGARALSNLGGPATYPAWSPDGLQLAVARIQADGSAHIHVTDLVGGPTRQLTTGTERDLHPTWSPDGRRMVFSRQSATSGGQLYVVNADGTGLTQITNGVDDGAPAWSPDGSWIAFSGQGPLGEARLYIVRPDGSGRESVLPLSQRIWGRSPVWQSGGAILLASAGDYLYALDLASRQQLWMLPLGAPLVGVSVFTFRP
jgi:hypothetical protein